MVIVINMVRLLLPFVAVSFGGKAAEQSAINNNDVKMASITYPTGEKRGFAVLPMDNR